MSTDTGGSGDTGVSVDTAAGLANFPDIFACKVQLVELDVLEQDLMLGNYNFIVALVEAAPELVCEGVASICHYQAMSEIAPNWQPVSLDGPGGPFQLFPAHMPTYLDEMAPCLTKDTNEGTPPGQKASGGLSLAGTHGN